eukprot:scaffold16299_cov110-Skeletonema_marinoi.AAC.5
MTRALLRLTARSCSFGGGGGRVLAVHSTTANNDISSSTTDNDDTFHPLPPPPMTRAQLRLTARSWVVVEEEVSSLAVVEECWRWW